MQRSTRRNRMRLNIYTATTTVQPGNDSVTDPVITQMGDDLIEAGVVGMKPTEPVMG